MKKITSRVECWQVPECVWKLVDKSYTRLSLPHAELIANDVRGNVLNLKGQPMPGYVRVVRDDAAGSRTAA